MLSERVEWLASWWCQFRYCTVAAGGVESVSESFRAALLYDNTNYVSKAQPIAPRCQCHPTVSLSLPRLQQPASLHLTSARVRLLLVRLSVAHGGISRGRPSVARCHRLSYYLPLHCSISHSHSSDCTSCTVMFLVSHCGPSDTLTHCFPTPLQPHSTLLLPTFHRLLSRPPTASHHSLPYRHLHCPTPLATSNSLQYIHSRHSPLHLHHSHSTYQSPRHRPTGSPSATQSLPTWQVGGCKRP